MPGGRRIVLGHGVISGEAAPRASSATIGGGGAEGSKLLCLLLREGVWGEKRGRGRSGLRFGGCFCVRGGDQERGRRRKLGGGGGRRPREIVFA